MNIKGQKKNPGKNYPVNVFKVKTKLINGILIHKKKSVIKSKGSDVKDAEQKFILLAVCVYKDDNY